MSTVQWFQMVGFRPAITTPPHRHDEVDYPRIVPAPDSDIPYSAKYTPPLLTPRTPLLDMLFEDIPIASQPPPTAASLNPPPPPYWHIPGYTPIDWYNPPPFIDCCTYVPPPIVTPPLEPAPVPLPPTALLLFVAIASLNRWRRS